jgi:hypothetical protein
MDETDSVNIAAYILAHLKPICENCHCTTTPQWRKGWVSDLLDRYVWLCNKCGIKYAKSQYCPHCKEIYSKDRNLYEPLKWYSCQHCGRWVHRNCENMISNNANLKNYNIYKCPNCR